MHHERQSLLLCGRHAVNALLQSDYGPLMTDGDLNKIADQCGAEVPHPLAFLGLSHQRTALLGNFSADVILTALANRGLETQWVRRDASATRQLQLDEAALGQSLGLLVNLKTRFLGLLPFGRHWIALRRIGETWFNLDSNLPEPKQLGTESGVLQYILDIDRTNDGVQVLLVRPKARPATTTETQIGATVQ
jgi:josephin